MLTSNDVFKIEKFMQEKWIPKYIEEILNDPIVFDIVNKNMKDEMLSKNFMQYLKDLLTGITLNISEQRISYLREQDKKTSIKIVGN